MEGKFRKAIRALRILGTAMLIDVTDNNLTFGH